MKFLPVGKQIAVCGRVQSRIYQKRLENETVEKRTAYEVSIGKIQVGADFDAMNDAAGAPRYTLRRRRPFLRPSRRILHTPRTRPENQLPLKKQKSLVRFMNEGFR